MSQPRPELEFKVLSLSEMEAADARWVAGTTAKERLDALEAIRRAAISLYRPELPERLARVLVALDFPPREVRRGRRSRVRDPRPAQKDLLDIEALQTKGR